MRYFKWAGTGDAPIAGDSGYMGYDWEETDKDNAQYVEMPYTTWGDYVGSMVERSNYLALVEDFPCTFIEISGGYYSHTLYLPMPYGPDGEALAEIIKGLDDYPLYNEEHHSQLEYDTAWDAWDQYLRSDIEGTWQVETDDWTDEDWEFVRSRYYAITYDQDSSPYAETADGMVFPYHDAVLETLVKELDTLGLEHDPRRPNPNQTTFKLYIVKESE